MEADGTVDAQNAPTAPWKTLRVFHELPQGLSHRITHAKPRKAPKWRWETRIDPCFGLMVEGTLHHFSENSLANSSISALRLQSRQHFFRSVSFESARIMSERHLGPSFRGALIEFILTVGPVTRLLKVQLLHSRPERASELLGHVDHPLNVLVPPAAVI